MQSNFPVLHNVDIVVLLEFETKWDGEINHLNLHSRYHDKCKFDLKLIWYSTIFNLFPLEVVQKYQRCQACVLWETPNPSDKSSSWDPQDWKSWGPGTARSSGLECRYRLISPYQTSGVAAQKTSLRHPVNYDVHAHFTSHLVRVP